MKKYLILLLAALMMMLSAVSLAEAESPQTAAPETQTETTTPFGGQFRRWMQSQGAPEQTVPQTGFVDADGDGLCDNCGNEQGKNIQAPNFADENKDGVCDHLGTDQQGQRQGRMQAMRSRMQGMRGRMQEMMGRMQNAQGRGQGMMGRGQQGQGNGAQGNAQGPNWLDADGNGVCDHFGTDTQGGYGHGRNRR